MTLKELRRLSHLLLRVGKNLENEEYATILKMVSDCLWDNTMHIATIKESEALINLKNED